MIGREEAVRQQRAALADAENAIHETVAKGVEAGRSQLAAQEAAKARRLVQQEIDQKTTALDELNAVLRSRESKLAEAQAVQADLLKRQRQLEDAHRELDLTVEQRVRAELSAVRGSARKEAENNFMLKIREREEQISGMQRQIEDLKRRAEQGSQQLQGEVQELELEAALRQKFPLDVVEPVGKGEFGGDLVQRVRGLSGQICGSILWEAKRTKNWSDGWLAKLRDDKRIAKAEIALIISHALPKNVHHFDQIDGVWVASPGCAIPVAIALRQSLIELSTVRLAGEGTADQDGGGLPVSNRSPLQAPC